MAAETIAPEIAVNGSRKMPRWALIAYTVLVFAFDLVTPGGFTVGILYLLAIMLAIRYWPHRAWSFAAAAAVLVVLGALLSPAGVPIRYVVANRIMSLLAIVVTTYLANVAGQRLQRLGELNANLQQEIVAKDEAVAEREAQEAELRTFLDHSPNLIFLKDMEGRYLHFNRQFAETFHRSLPESIGQTDEDIFPAVQAAQFRDHDLKVIAAGHSMQFDEVAEHDDGLHQSIATKFPLFDQNGQVVAVGGIITDLTERSRLEAQMTELRNQLAHAGRLVTLGELASVLAHELNQPLTAMHLFATAAEQLCATIDAPELKNCLTKIGEQSLRAGAIVGRMRSFAKRGPSTRTMTDLNQLIRDVLPLLESEFQRGTVSADLSLGVDLPTVRVDPIQIQQVLVNLIRNAIEAIVEHSAANRIVTISTEMADNGVRFAVADSGGGLPREIQENLFQPFQTTKLSGLGLGLSICRTVVEAHGRQLQVQSSPGKGTVISFVLPQSQESDS